MVSRRRLDPEIFNLPVAKMRAGYYSDNGLVKSCSPTDMALGLPCRSSGKVTAARTDCTSLGVIHRTAVLFRLSILATVEVRMDGDQRDVR